jgi:hypothetical protein
MFFRNKILALLICKSDMIRQQLIGQACVMFIINDLFSFNKTVAFMLSDIQTDIIA